MGDSKLYVGNQPIDLSTIKEIGDGFVDSFMGSGNLIKISLIDKSKVNEMLFEAALTHTEIPLSIKDFQVMVKVSKITAKEDYFEWILRIA